MDGANVTALQALRSGPTAHQWSAVDVETPRKGTSTSFPPERTFRASMTRHRRDERWP